MANGQITIDDLAGMIKKGFDENTAQHQKILNVLDKHAIMLIDHTERLVDHTERLTRIEKKLEGVVYRGEFDELKGRISELENLLAVNKKT